MQNLSFPHLRNDIKSWAQEMAHGSRAMAEIHFLNIVRAIDSNHWEQLQNLHRYHDFAYMVSGGKV
jgi:hypothetical protein